MMHYFTCNVQLSSTGRGYNGESHSYVSTGLLKLGAVMLFPLEPEFEVDQASSKLQEEPAHVASCGHKARPFNLTKSRIMLTKLN